jgi:hypothetical protein
MNLKLEMYLRQTCAGKRLPSHTIMHLSLTMHLMLTLHLAVHTLLETYLRQYSNDMAAAYRNIQVLHTLLLVPCTSSRDSCDCHRMANQGKQSKQKDTSAGTWASMWRDWLTHPAIRLLLPQPSSCSRGWQHSTKPSSSHWRRLAAAQQSPLLSST